MLEGAQPGLKGVRAGGCAPAASALDLKMGNPGKPAPALPPSTYPNPTSAATNARLCPMPGMLHTTP